MKTFEVNKDVKIVCDHVSTRYGFKHEAVLYQNGRRLESAKVCYHNRTWESFEYESVIKKLLKTTDILSKKQKTDFLNGASGADKREVEQMFRTLGMVASIGDALCNDQSEKNDWKIRMLRAGLPDLNMPSDWNSLSENDKESRLDKVIAELKH